MESSNSLAEQLVNACSKKEVARVEQLLDEGACPSELVSYDSVVTSALHLVCGKLGDLHLLKVLTSRTCNVDVKDVNGCTPFHYACFHGHIDLATHLIHTLKCDPNVKDSDGKTPLHMACSFLSLEQEQLFLKIVQLLTSGSGFDCNTVTNKGETPLMLLCSNSCNKAIAEHLVHRCHCDISQKDSGGNTALHLACMCSNLKEADANSNVFIDERNLHVVKIITAAGNHCGIHLLNYQNKCPLEIAIANDFVKVASFLIAEMNKISDSEYSMSPLHIACIKKNMKLIQLLKKLKCASSPPDKNGDTPLHIVCKEGDFDILRKLLKMNCDIFAQNSKGELPIQLAIQNNHLAIVRQIWSNCSMTKDILRLVKSMHGFPFQFLDIPQTLLHRACGCGTEYSDLDVLKVLKDYCINHNSKLIDHREEINGITPLQWACISGFLDNMVYLINEYKADVTVRTINGYSLLHLVNANVKIYKSTLCSNPEQTALEMVKFLIANVRCDPNTTTYEGDTPLMQLADNDYRRGHSIAHYYIFDCNCDLTVQNNVGNTALHIACKTGNDLVAQMIVDRDNSRALLTKKNKEGNTPLHLACHKGKLNMVYILALCTTDFGQYEINKSNHTPLQLATVNCHHEVVFALSRVIAMGLTQDLIQLLLSDAQKKEDTQLIYCLAISRHRNFKSKHGDTLLHIACEVNSSDLCEVLLKKCFDVNVTNKNGDTPLHVACQVRSIHSCEILLKADCKINIKNMNGDTPLHIACQMNSTDLCELLLEVCCDVNTVNKNGDTPLHIACQMNSTDLCELLLEACCDVNTVNKNGDTPLHLAFSSGSFEVAQLLISEPQVKTGLNNTAGDTLLHIACKTQLCTPEMVNYILVVIKSDPNAANNEGMKPIQLTTNAQKIHELIRYGANPMDVYIIPSGVKVSIKNPPQPLVKIFVVGNPSVGKSTLIAALQKELSRIVKILTPAKKVSGVEEKTAGIIPCEFESKKYGQVALYDFAGQAEYYSTHAALLQNSIESSPPIFLIVVNLCQSYDEIKKNILYWLTFLENQCTSVDKELRPHVIVIGSHADILESKGEKTQEKASVLDHIKDLPHFKSLKVTDFISMDCQFSQSAGMKRLRKQLQDSCEKLRIKEEIRFNTHCFLVYLLDKFRDSTAVTLDKIFVQVCSERKVASESNPLFFLPDCLSSLFELCFELNDRGHILFLKDKKTLTNSWVVLDKQSLLNEVLGTIFAPEGLKEYSTLASNTGVVPTSKLAKTFSNYDSNMVVGFLTHLEFCHEVSDEEVLQLINEESQTYTTTSNSELKTYLFFPALIKLEAPDGIWKDKPLFVNRFGWMLQCSRPEQFFMSRFLEVLLLRLAFSCALATDTSTESDGPSLKRKCTIWKNGIFWGDRYGVETLVEVQSDGKTVVVLMRSFQENLTAFLQLRSRIIQKVLTTVSDFCARVNTLEYFIDPSEVNYPRNSKTHFSAQDVFNAIVLRSTCVVSENGESLPLETLLTFDPYPYLGHKILSKMFSGDTSQYKKRITDDDITRLPDQFAQNCDIISKILCCDDRADSASSQSRDLIRSFKAWREKSDGSYHCLRQTFDQYSVCAGRNLLVRKSIVIH